MWWGETPQTSREKSHNKFHINFALIVYYSIVFNINPTTLQPSPEITLPITSEDISISTYYLSTESISQNLNSNSAENPSTQILPTLNDGVTSLIHKDTTFIHTPTTRLSEPILSIEATVTNNHKRSVLATVLSINTLDSEVKTTSLSPTQTTTTALPTQVTITTTPEITASPSPATVTTTTSDDGTADSNQFFLPVWMWIIIAIGASILFSVCCIICTTIICIKKCRSYKAKSRQDRIRRKNECTGEGNEMTFSTVDDLCFNQSNKGFGTMSRWDSFRRSSRRKVSTFKPNRSQDNKQGRHTVSTHESKTEFIPTHIANGQRVHNPPVGINYSPHNDNAGLYTHDTSASPTYINPSFVSEERVLLGNRSNTEQRQTQTIHNNTPLYSNYYWKILYETN